MLLIHWFNGDKSVRKCLIFGITCWLAFGLLACSKTPQHPKTPTAVVQALFVRIEAVKDAKKTIPEESSPEEATTILTESRAALNSLFLDPRRAKLIMMPLLLLDLDDVDFLEEKIDGNNAEVKIEHTVVGFGRSFKLQESAQRKRQMTFQLVQPQEPF